MVTLCLGCYTVFREKTYHDQYRPHSPDYTPCPIAACESELIQVDELMVPSIINLNKLGYYTDFSCSSHTWETDDHPLYLTSIYISFKPEVQLPGLPKNIPRGFHRELVHIDPEDVEEAGGKWRLIIRQDMREHDTFLGKQQQIFSAMNSLLSWTMKLPHSEDQEEKKK
jgi:hypothetical protein